MKLAAHPDASSSFCACSIDFLNSEVEGQKKKCCKKYKKGKKQCKSCPKL